MGRQNKNVVIYKKLYDQISIYVMALEKLG